MQIPVMRKEFNLDPYQILEARVAGADCVLLIAECLDDAQLRDLYQQAQGLGWQALIELHVCRESGTGHAIEPGDGRREQSRFEGDEDEPQPLY